MLSTACRLARGTSSALYKVFILAINVLESMVSHLSASTKVLTQE